MSLRNNMEKQGQWLFRFRGILPIVVLAAGVYAYMQTEIHPDRYFLEGTAWEYVYELICVFISVAGLVIRVFTVGYTPENTSGRNVRGQVADQLNTAGLYSLVRNPLYLGNFLMWLGIALWSMNVWFVIMFVFFYWLYYERIILAEEKYLTEKFGREYTEWAENTPCFIMRFKGYRKPSVKFSWKKVIKKEKNGLLALILIFSALDITGEFICGEPPKYIWLAVMAIAAILFYLVVKYLKYRTNLLHEEGR